MTDRFQLCAIGNALVDILVSTDDAFLQANSVTKGAMTLVDEERARVLYDRAGAAVEMSSGGSAANTLAGFASLGGHCAYMGKIGRDQFGDAFIHDMRAQSIHFDTPRALDLGTGCCLVLVTPDGERSMNTFLGAATEFGVQDIDVATIEASAVTYLEGYLFDKTAAKEAFLKAAGVAHAAGRKVALSLSDGFCVGRHREAFLDLVRGEVDILFANDQEVKMLYQTDDVQSALGAASQHTEIAVVTQGVKGALIAAGGHIHEVPAQAVQQVVDTTGAGDLYAAGFLYGIATGKSLTESGRIGAAAAAEVISHFGPRPQVKLASLV